jgi:hypothetical protein
MGIAFGGGCRWRGRWRGEGEGEGEGKGEGKGEGDGEGEGKGTGVDWWWLLSPGRGLFSSSRFFLPLVFSSLSFFRKSAIPDTKKCVGNEFVSAILGPVGQIMCRLLAVGRLSQPSVKKFVNWNLCFSCGFDVEEGHTSKTCPANWRKMNHQEGFTRENSRQWINAGYDPCTKGMHKSQFPNF